MSESKKLTSKDITMLGIRSSFLQASFNYERMQSGGFTWAPAPALKKIYGDDKEKLSAALTDNMAFINTHPNLVGFLMGLMISLEEGGANRETVNGLKLALFGPIAGIGDAIFWFTILPIVAGISAGIRLRTDHLLPDVSGHLDPAYRMDKAGLSSGYKIDRHDHFQLRYPRQCRNDPGYYGRRCHDRILCIDHAVAGHHGRRRHRGRCTGTVLRQHLPEPAADGCDPAVLLAAS